MQGMMPWPTVRCCLSPVARVLESAVVLGEPTLPASSAPRPASSPRSGDEARNQALRRFRCTSNSEIAAGVTPLIRAAWPTVAGCVRLSLSSTSDERPRTLS